MFVRGDGLRCAASEATNLLIILMEQQLAASEQLCAELAARVASAEEAESEATALSEALVERIAVAEEDAIGEKARAAELEADNSALRVGRRMRVGVAPPVSVTSTA